MQTPPSTHLDPGIPGEGGAREHALLELGPVIRALADLRHRYHWSVDAVLVAVLEKAWASLFGAPPAHSSWLVARDLRPALGVTRGIGNLSVPAGVSLPDSTADLHTMVDQAQASLQAQSDDAATAAAAMRRFARYAEPAFTAMVRRNESRRAYRSLSNVGQLGGSLDDWGDATLSRVWFVGPLAHPPYTSFIATGNGSSTLVSVRTSPGWLTADHARRLEQAALDLV